MSFRNDQVSGKETEKILGLAEECLKVEGDYVEFGCYKGDTSLLLAELLVEKSVDKSVGKLIVEKRRSDCGFMIRLRDCQRKVIMMSRCWGKTLR